MNTHLSKLPYLKPVSYKQTIDGVLTDVNTQMLIIPAIVVGIPEDIRELNNTNKTKWRLITVQVNHPTKGLQTENAQMFEVSHTKFGDIFTKGGEVELAVQTTGDYKGYAKAQLPSTKQIEVDDFVSAMKATKEAILQTTQFVGATSTTDMDLNGLCHCHQWSCGLHREYIEYNLNGINRWFSLVINVITEDSGTISSTISEVR